MLVKPSLQVGSTTVRLEPTGCDDGTGDRYFKPLQIQASTAIPGSDWPIGSILRGRRPDVTVRSVVAVHNTCYTAIFPCKEHGSYRTEEAM
jgi:hypothetical protein